MSNHSTEEIWKDIPGYKRRYQVSNLGRVKSLRRKCASVSGGRTVPERILKPGYIGPKNGHQFIYLQKDGKKTHKLLHRLVLEIFVGRCPRGKECRHFPDRNPQNNCLSNFQWGTKKENNGDKKKQGTNQEGERHGLSKLTNQKVKTIRYLYSKGWTQVSLAEKFHVSQHCIWCVVNRITWTHI